MQGHKTLNAASVSLLQRLHQFQSLFEAADANGSGSLNVDAFVAAFKGE